MNEHVYRTKSETVLVLLQGFIHFVYLRFVFNLLLSISIFPVFVTLAEQYVSAIQHGAVPDVDDAFTAAAKKRKC
jgi:hypothetical protein